MSGFLLDTNVVSELIRKKPEPSVFTWVDSINEELLYLSVLTFGEIRKGIARLPLDARRTKLEVWLEVELTEWLGDRILPIDRAISERWGRLAGDSRSPLPIVDGLLAATALHYDLTLVTRNVRDLQRTNVPLFNPWQA